ncbi:peptidyl-prolyl cis-trans isomerase [Uliginosibacterium sp. H3]|uniref:peptidylprolyl isomerase n=1 Tax=Uliginosibacterium silvisoli TaxID=3114758 RepID=A0ABU6K7X2_9RHOO|nr:peptidyl-prolyl cis-trans isomerase [Uliginosibacterium sp. H3]
MHLKLSLLAAALIATAASLPAVAQTSKKPAAGAATSAPAIGSKAPVATVNGNPISAGMAELLVNEQLAQGQQNTPELRNAVREELIKRELLAQEARKRGLDKSEPVTSRIDLARQSILLGLYLDAYLKEHPISDAEVRAEYDRQIALAGDKEYKVRHILVEKEEDAQAIIKKLAAGGKFEELAKDSKDTGTKDNGGDLGWGRAVDYANNFGNVVPSLEKGAYTKQPVKSNFGYHVLMLDDTRKPELPEFAAVSDKVKQALIQQTVQKRIAELMSTAKIQ